MPGCAKFILAVILLIAAAVVGNFFGGGDLAIGIGLLAMIIVLMRFGDPAKPDPAAPAHHTLPPDIAALHAEIAHLRSDVEALKAQMAALHPQSMAAAPAMADTPPFTPDPVVAAPAVTDTPPFAPAPAVAVSAPQPALRDKVKIPPPLPPLPERKPPVPPEAPPAAGRIWLRDFFRENLPVKAGIAILFLGLAFLLRFASERIVISLPLRYLGVVGAAAVLGGFGWYLRHKRRDYALAIQGAAVAILYLTALAALKLHQLIEPASAFLFMSASAALMIALALRQDACLLAQIALAGGLASPLLTASGSNNYIGLFAYLALLNGAVAVIARFKAWRSLNLISFTGTAAIAVLWGSTYYLPDYFTAVLPFLVYHLVLYTLIVYFHACRTRGGGASLPDDDAPLHTLLNHHLRGMAHIGVPDSSLLFACAFTAFGLLYAMVQSIPGAPALCALAFAAYYALCALLVWRREVAPLPQAFTALAVLFAACAIPLWLDPAQTAIGWSLQAALVYAFAVRQHNPLARFFALVLHLLAALSLLPHYAPSLPPGSAPLLNGPVTAALLTATGGIFILALRQQTPARTLWETRILTATAAATLLYLLILPLLLLPVIQAAPLIAALALLPAWWGLRHQANLPALPACALILLALLLVFYAGGNGMASAPAVYLSLSLTACFALACARLLHLQTRRAPHYGGWLLLLTACAVFACVLHDSRWIARFMPYTDSAWIVILIFTALALLPRWREAALLTFAYLPLLAASLFPLFAGSAGHGEWLAVLICALALHLFILIRRADAPGVPLILAHALGLNLFALAFARLGYSVAPADTAWAFPALLAAPLLILWLLTRSRVQALIHPYSAAYHGIFALPFILFTALAVLFWNIFSGGSAPPLPYIPILNPLEISTLLALYLLWQWFRHSEVPHGLPSLPHPLPLALLAILFATLSLLRISHHYFGLPWQSTAFLQHFGVQAALSLLWAVSAIILMMRGTQRNLRPLWFAGAGLMGIVVVKLFLVDLGDSGGIARIVSFIGVGILLLLVGYFAPLPNKENT